ncbi:polyamine aminopropyltransferase [uncultured Cetobacterium sp.]|uniref:polyamine aminopropyltransferase n=1 Tax=uncultured Cetobacterium sp. TaxID=527638 RepID=UPI0025DA56CE|nr:polyamine aminopropyltransferase [uncultured Cetobacterium sp.]
MLDLWFTEKWSENTKFSIKVKEHLYSEETPFQKIDFFTSDEYGRFFTLDGMVMITEKDEFIYHEMIAHVPMCTNLNIKRVLVIGGGDGGTVRELTRYNSIEKIDMVEIDERVVRLSQKYLPFTSDRLEDERVTLIFDDGLKFVEECESGAYDLILVDSTDPISVGEGLFTTEFYKNCFRVLKEDGILVNQHESPYYERYATEMKKAHEKIKNIFPIAKVYQFHQPTYASGHWLFGFASKKYDPVSDCNESAWNALGLETNYYNTDIQRAAFALPNYVKKQLEK